MFTVLIAEKKVLDDIKEYEKLLGCMYDSQQVAFCEWHTEKKEINAIVPQLLKSIEKKEKWRAVVVCNETNLKQDNPFDFVKYYDCITGKEDDETIHRIKMDFYDKAVENPLVRLAACLSVWPAVTAEFAPDADKGLLYYQEEMKKKLDLWKTLVQENYVKVQLPEEFLCIARRNCDSLARIVKDSWSVRLEIEYSNFYDYNLYFDSMRYLVFDILDKRHLDYNYDYLRFLAVVLTIANNETPRGCLTSGRIYRINCESNKQALQKLVSGYDKKLANTESMILSAIKEMEGCPREYLSDEEIKEILDKRIEIDNFDKENGDHKKCFVNEKFPGIATDIPRNESTYWTKAYENTFQALYSLLKSVRRSIKCTSQNVSELNVMNENNEKIIQDYQYEDIAEFIEKEEKKLMEEQPHCLYDVNDYTEKMKKKGFDVKTKIDKHMKMVPILALSSIVFVFSFVGIVPFLSRNNSSDTQMIHIPLILSLGFMICVILTVFILLFLFRHKVRKSLHKYNMLMGEITGEIDKSKGDYSVYISRIFNLMRAYSLIKHDKEQNLECNRVHILKKHFADIHGEREALKDILGQYLIKYYGEKSDEDCSDNYYDYNYFVVRKYDYPIPGLKTSLKRIVYMEDGNYVVVPDGLIEKISLKREELYD